MGGFGSWQSCTSHVNISIDPAHTYSPFLSIKSCPTKTLSGIAKGIGIRWDALQQVQSTEVPLTKVYATPEISCLYLNRSELVSRETNELLGRQDFSFNAPATRCRSLKNEEIPAEAFPRTISSVS